VVLISSPALCRLAGAISCYLAGHGDPRFLALLQYVVQRSAQNLHAERLTNDERMQRNGEHQRILLRPPQHLVELIANHVFEITRRLLTRNHGRDVIQLQRIRH